MQNLYILLFVGLAVVNFFAFAWVGADKKQSLSRSERLPEVSFFFISIFFASLGVLLGMFFYRHKTKKIYFPVGVSLLLIQQIFLLALILEKIATGNQ